MNELNRKIGFAFRNELRKGYEPKAIAKLAFDLSMERGLDSDIHDLLDRISLLETPGFGNYTLEELELLANFFVLDVSDIRERFLPMASQHGYLFYKDKVDLAIGKWFIIMLSNDLSKQNLLEELAFGLQLPDFSNKASLDWVDALEWFIHLDWIIEPKILIVHDDVPLRSDLDEQKKYFEFLSDVAKIWYGDVLGYDHYHEIYYAFPQRFSSEVKDLIIAL